MEPRSKTKNLRKVRIGKSKTGFEKAFVNVFSDKTMLKAVQHFRIATLRKHRIVKRTVRLRLVPKATAVDPRQFLIFDNVDGTARKEKNTLKTETSSSASAPSSRAEAEDWVEDKERVIVDWGSEEETPSTKQTEESRFRNEGTAHYKASSISVLLDDDRVFSILKILMGFRFLG